MAVDTSVRHSPESVEVDAREQHWKKVRRRVAVGYLVLLGSFVVFVGIPEDRLGLLLWTIGGLGIRCLGRGWRSFARILLDWLPFTAVLVMYDYTRGVADTLGMPVHVHGPADADLWMFHGVLPTAWMQQHFYVPGDVRWYDAVVTLVYTSHFVTTPVVAAILWLRNRELWVRFIGRVIALAFVGLATYILYPAAPPWFAANEGVIQPVVRITSRGWDELGLSHAGQLLSEGQASVNLVAAMPSLHTAYATLIALFFVRRVPWWGRGPLMCYPVVMGAALIYAGEHYAVDVFFGWAAGALVTVAMLGAERRRAARRAVAATEPTEPAPAVAGEVTHAVAGDAGNAMSAPPVRPAPLGRPGPAGADPAPGGPATRAAVPAAGAEPRSPGSAAGLGVGEVEPSGGATPS